MNVNELIIELSKLNPLSKVLIHVNYNDNYDLVPIDYVVSIPEKNETIIYI